MRKKQKKNLSIKKFQEMSPVHVVQGKNINDVAVLYKKYDKEIKAINKIPNPITKIFLDFKI